jgi:hypothetical protein
MGSIYVLNLNTQDHEDRYDGVDYQFPAKPPHGSPIAVLIPKEAATHMFGWNLKDKTDVLVRLGKATEYDPKSKNFVQVKGAIQWLANFVFDEVAQVQQSTLEKRTPSLV